METPAHADKTISPNNQYESLFKTEFSSADASNIDAIEERFAARLASEPDCGEKFFWLGNARILQAGATSSPQALQGAIQAYEQAAQLDPHDLRIYSNLLGAYLSLDDKEGARRTMVQWIENDPDPSPEKRAFLAGQKAEHKMYCRACGETLVHDPYLLACPICKKRNPGWIVVVPGSTDPAVQAIKTNALQYHSRGLTREAVDELKKAVSLAPQDATIYNNLGVFYLELGDLSNAKKQLTKALQVDPNLDSAKRMLKRIEEKPKNKEVVPAPASLLSDAPNPGQSAEDKMKESIKAVLSSKNVDRSAKALLGLRVCQQMIKAGRDLSEVKPTWDQVVKARPYLPPKCIPEYDVITAAYAPPVTVKPKKEKVEKEKTGFIAEIQALIARAKAFTSTDPVQAEAILADASERIRTRFWPMGKDELKTDILLVRALMDRPAAIQGLNDIAYSSRERFILEANKTTMLLPEEWSLLVTQLEMKNVAEIVWENFFEKERKPCVLPPDLLAGLVPFYQQFVTGLLAFSAQQESLKGIMERFADMLKAGLLTGASPLVEAVLVSMSKVAIDQPMWWSRFLLLENIIQYAAMWGQVEPEGLKRVLVDVPTYLETFIQACVAGYQASSETAGYEFTTLKRQTQDEMLAKTWFLTVLVKRGMGKDALALAEQAGRFSELANHVRRAWISQDLVGARQAISPDDMAGDPIGEFLVIPTVTARAAHLRKITRGGTLSLPEKMWVVPAPEEGKKNIFGRTVKPRWTINQQVEAYIERTPLYAAVPPKMDTDEQFENYLRLFGWGEYHRQTLDPVLLEALVAWGDENASEVKALTSTLWEEIQPEDFIFGVDFLTNAIFERCTTVLAADPTTVVSEMAAWVQREWVQLGRNMTTDNKATRVKYPKELIINLCFKAAYAVDGLSPQRRDQIISKAIVNFPGTASTINTMAMIYGQDKPLLNFQTPFKLPAFQAEWQQGIVEVAVPAIGQAFQSRKAAPVGLCDMCNHELARGEGKPYTADEFRALVARGFEPPEAAIQHAIEKGATREQFIQKWKYEFVPQSQTGWMLCADCQKTAVAYAPVVGETTETQKSGPIAGMGLCDVCNEPLPLAEGTTYSAEAFRRLVIQGFEPDERVSMMSEIFGISRQSFVEDWKRDLVAQTTTGWLLCSNCAARARLYERASLN